MLSLRYYLCLFYTNYASTKKQCYVVSCSSVYFLPPQRMRTIWAIGWEVWFCQHFRGSIKFTGSNFRMLLLWYHYVIIHAVFTRIMLWQRCPQRSCVTLIIWLYVYSCSDGVMVLSIYHSYLRKHCHLTAILSCRRIFSKELLLFELPAIIWDSRFMTSKE